MATLNPSATTDGTWLSRWEPENTSFWSAGASRLAWRTLTITTLNLTMAFIVWFLVSALVVRLPQIGFKFTPQQLFWLAAPCVWCTCSSRPCSARAWWSACPP